jgi:Na+/proline symporter
MSLGLVDWSIVAAYFVVSLAIGLYFTRRAGRDVGEFFLSGRNLPWWLAGTSMVATTFAADTPLAVTGLVARYGIAGNWLWWNFAFGGMLTVFFFARLWRRAGILTDVEFAELRYSGRPAALLRGFRALYLGIPINAMIIGWVNLAMAKILQVTLGWDRLTAVLVSLAVTGVYSALSGLWGVVVTDFFQFLFAMTGTIALAVIALRSPGVGGVAGLKAALPASTFDFLPHLGTGAEGAVVAYTLPVLTFLAYVGVQWWSSWYPGSEPGGGGYVAQRIMSAKDERHSFLATLLFTIAHYCLRPWPWILVGLASIVLYPDIADKEAGYVMVMRDLLPPGWRGFLLGAFFAAYMSTIATQLNWGTSYVVNDFYKRFVKKDGSQAHYVWVSRLSTLMMMVLGGLVTLVLRDVAQAWQFLIESGAGIGLVLILRWYWWRVSAWSEISALVASAAGFVVLRLFTPLQFPHTLLALVGWTTVVWLVVTFATPPEPEDRLRDFFRRVRPDGPGWRRVAKDAGLPAPGPLGALALDWLLGCVLVYSMLFGVGALLFGSVGAAVPYLAAAAASAGLLYRSVSRRGFEALLG